MIIKVKHILIIFLVLILGIVTVNFILNKNKNNNEENIIDDELIYKDYDMEYSRSGEKWLELCYIVAKKNGDWSKLPLTKNFRKKYNEKDGILGNIQYDNIEYRPYADTNEEYYFKNYYTYFVITQNGKETAYIFSPEYVDDDVLLNDVGIFDTVLVKDESGTKIKSYGHYFNDNSYWYCFNMLSRGNDDELSVAVTEKFHKKYPFFLDLFIHYSPLSFNHIEFNSKKSSWEDKEAYFTVDSKLECKKRDYKVKFKVDGKGYLDEAEVELIKEEEYTGKKENRANATAKALYLHSNLDNINLTDEFKERLKKKGSYFDDIDKIDINDIGESTYIGDDGTEKIVCYRMKDGTINSYYRKYIISDDNKISDIISKKLEYTNMSSEEVAKLYLENAEK